ncbi:MAG: CBS domain-containing protein [Pseudomonadota bacterium]
MAPASYRAPTVGDAQRNATVSQSVSSNVSNQTATVSKLLDHKGQGAFTIRPSDTLKDAVQVLKEKRIGALIVTDSDGVMQGILSERDIVRQLAVTPGQTLPQTVEENMTRNVVTCKMADPLVSVLQRMTDGRFRHMPVMEGDLLVGIVTIGDVVNYRLNELEHEALQLKQMIVG